MSYFHYKLNWYLRFVIKADFLLLAKAMPAFLKALDGTIYLKEGMSHTLECDVIGLPTPVMTWYHDGNLLKPYKEILFNANKTR